MRHILTRAYNDKSIACNVKSTTYIGQSIACNVTLMMETSPHTMQKAPHLMQNAPHIMKNAPHIMMGNHLQALTGLNFFFSGFIVYMKKLLSSDWLR